MRSWGKTVIITEPSTTFDLNNLAKEASDERDVMALIKSDIDSSASRFGANFSFKFNDKAFWSKAATQMLKAEVYLWSSRQMAGGVADATVAKDALTDIRTNIPSLGLMANFKDIFSSSSLPASKNNKEVIFVLRNALLEYNMGGGAYANTFLAAVKSDSQLLRFSCTGIRFFYCFVLEICVK